ncbi:anion permease [Tetragenococcus koreensis]|uniref:2-oxoglutarate translocator n=1 Tax=Tetragenococcus koreensis TaxID=290335 RepID=A0AAN4RJN2_9ENTE|nr:SLC13 family permease [Tetragenococcus koreensis]MCF1585310.1 anion permease [Tetragenococcus koreensis]MCF1614883.1 anion permease [Tetragenococcus koreensis]MCF1616368.1 anion permease [Tetragenococcus koreensis]MCF1618890.1 anion permease [Tetragenococcus koreensis]MCF1621281.1 anion permease [Tetragenococcus koreensis]
MKNRKTPIMVFALLAIFLFRFVPAPAGLSSDGMQVVGIFLGTLLLWIFVGIDWPSLLCLAALTLVPTLDPAQVFASSFGNETFTFLLFTFMLTYALSQTTIIKRIALTFITSNWAQKGAWQLALLFLLSVLLMGLFISPTVLFFIMLPILEEIYEILSLKKGSSFASMLMIGLVVSCSLSSGMTPIAHVFPVIALGVFESIANVTISYAGYMAFAIPAGLLIFLFMLLLFRFVLKPDMTQFKQLNKADFKQTVSDPITKREKIILFVFTVVILLWVAPGIIAPILPGVAELIESFGTAIPPLAGVVVLAIVRLEGKPLLVINEAITKGVSWPSLIMAASTLAIGSALTNEKIGLIAYVSNVMAPIAQGLAPLLIVALFITWATFESNIGSHMVTAQVVTSVAVPIALSSNAIEAASLAAVIGLVASIGSATPPSMPYVAIAGSSGWTNTVQMLKYGMLIAVGTIFIALLIAYPLANVFINV